MQTTAGASSPRRTPWWCAQPARRRRWRKVKPRPRELQAQLEELKERMNSRMDEMQAAHAAETRELKAMLRQLLVKR